jgi:hypothetical protein
MNITRQIKIGQLKSLYENKFLSSILMIVWRRIEKDSQPNHSDLTVNITQIFNNLFRISTTIRDIVLNLKGLEHMINVRVGLLKSNLMC